MDNFGTLLGHNIWQSILIFALVFTVLKLVRQTSAEERSWSWSAALFAVALLPMAAFLPGEGIKIERQQSSVAASNIMPVERPDMLSQAVIPHREVVPAPVSPVKMIDKQDVVAAVSLVWAGGFLFVLFRLGLAWFNASELRRSAYPIADNLWSEDVEVAISERISGPMVIGIIKPLILIPRDFAYGMEKTELEPLLYHELAHIKRRDNILYMIERLVMAFYWWNPVMHFIAGRIAEERELACDDRAARNCGDSLIYAKSLLKGARKLVGSDKTILGLAALRRESVLSKRVKRLTVQSRIAGLNISRLVKKLSAIMVAMMVLGLVTPRIAIGQVDQQSESGQNTVQPQDENRDDQMISDQEKAEIDADIKAALADMISKEELAQIRADALASMPSVEELEREREQALAEVPSEEELARIIEEAKAEIPTAEELEKIQREAMEDMLSAQEIEKIRKEALASMPTVEEIKKIREDALATVPSVEELAQIRDKAIKNMPSVEELERIREEAIANMPTEEDFERMRDAMRDALENMPTEAEMEQIRQDVRESMQQKIALEKRIKLRETIIKSISESRDKDGS